MKKGFLIILFCLLIGSLFTVASGKTIYVDDDGGKDYTNIQDAINAASDGDTIYVYGGTYYENITIDKSITLKGEDKATTIINSGDKGHALYVHDTTNVIIESLSITAGRKDLGGGAGSPYSGIRFTAVTESTINNCIISNCASKGIYISYSDSYNNIISNNICSNNHGGIVLSGSFNNLIINNNCSNNEWTGIEIDSSNNTIVNNTIFSNGFTGVLIISNNQNYIEVPSGETGTTYSTKNNILYHNRFKNNNKNARDNGLNIWCSKELKEGNYWDDYKGTDSNGDGIGDIPYNIPGGNNKDEYPLGYFRENYKPPNATFYYSPLESYTNQTISFYLPINFDPYKEITNFRWSFGDGGIAFGSDMNNISHIYEKAGNYTVTLTISDDSNYNDTFSRNIIITSLSEEKNGTPGFELIFALIAVVLVLFWQRRRMI